jgi:hypothetical protein
VIDLYFTLDFCVQLPRPRLADERAAQYCAKGMRAETDSEESLAGMLPMQA